MQLSEIVKTLKEQAIGMKILYVEDDADIRNTTSELFKSIFPFVETAENGQEGLKKFKEDSFDIVISDLMMPKMNGIEMSKKIKDIKPSQHIIVLSAYNETDYLLELINLGVSRFILKPLQTQQLFSVLLDLVSNIYNVKKVEIEMAKNIEQDRVIQRQARLAQMGEMISMIAHQWRQPLNALGLVIQKTKIFHDRGILTADKIDSNLETGMQLIGDMTKTIDQFMNMVKVDTDKKVFYIQDVLDKVQTIMEAQLKAKDIELICDVNSSLQLENYESEFFHVLLNLIANALDAFDDKEIDQKRISISAFSKDGVFKCIVSDNAGGIPEKHIDKIFNPYFSTKEQGKGTGLGLDMSRRMLKEYIGGEIDVYNDKDGAVFTITIKDIRT